MKPIRLGHQTARASCSCVIILAAVPSLLTVKSHGTGEQTVVDASGFEQPTWSPDGTMLAIGVLHGGQEGDLTIMRVNGTVVRTIRRVTSQIYDIAWQPLQPRR